MQVSISKNRKEVLTTTESTQLYFLKYFDCYMSTFLSSTPVSYFDGAVLISKSFHIFQRIVQNKSSLLMTVESTGSGTEPQYPDICSSHPPPQTVLLFSSRHLIMSGLRLFINSLYQNKRSLRSWAMLGFMLFLAQRVDTNSIFNDRLMTSFVRNAYIYMYVIHFFIYVCIHLNTHIFLSPSLSLFL